MHVVIVGEYTVQDLLLGKRLATALYQHAQHSVFARGQSQGLAAQRELLAGAVIHQRTTGLALVLVATRAAHQGVQACLQLGQLERLGQKVVRPPR